MGQFLLEDNGEGKILRAGNSLTIDNATSFRDILIEAFRSTENLAVDLSLVENVDISCIQLLCASCISFSKAGKAITVTGGLSDSFKKILQSIAIDPSTCDSSIISKCLWDMGDSND